jgi:DNA recombination protein RmuC
MLPDMDGLAIGLLLAVALLVVVLVFLQLRPRERDAALRLELQGLKEQLGDLQTRQLEAQNQALLRQGELFNQTHDLLGQRLGSIMQTVNENLNQTQTRITAQLGQTGSVVGEIHKKLGALEETAREIRAIGQDISSLQDLLRAPKLRGNLGEYLLEDLLRQIFPAENFTIKHPFRNGTQVDAVIHLGDGLIPVDAKFPLESFQRLALAATDEEKKRARREFVVSVRKRIDEIASKYILPAEKTYDFALMYIPAENVYYEAVINGMLTDKPYEILDYAIERHVIPVSPNSFYAYLMAILHGLRGMHVEQKAKEIIVELARVQDGFNRFFGDFQLLGRHINNASTKYDEAARKAERFNDRLGRLTGSGGELGDVSPELPPG